MEGQGDFYQTNRERPGYGISLVMMAFLSIATFNGIDILVKVYFTFRRRSGLYFWSIVTATIGIFLYVPGFIIKLFLTADAMRWVGIALIVLGWVPMVSCQSLALYSRLHLVMRDTRKLRWVRNMILVDAALFHIPPCILIFLAETSIPRANAYMAFEKVQVSVFTLQEFIIAGLYIYEACTKVLKPLPEPRPAPLSPISTSGTTATNNSSTSSTLDSGLYGNRNTLRGIRRHLIYVNCIVVALDATLLGTQFANFYRVQTTYKAFVYSVKLKLEFAILNRLVAAVRRHDVSFQSDHGLCYTGTVSRAQPPEFCGHGGDKFVRLGPAHQQQQVTTTTTTVSGGSACGDSVRAASCTAHPHGAGEFDFDEEATLGMRRNEVLKTVELRIESHREDPEEAEWRRSQMAVVAASSPRTSIQASESLRPPSRPSSRTTSEISFAGVGY